MATAQEIANKATFRRLHEAVNSGDEALIAQTIDEVFEPDVLIRTPLPVDAAGAQAIKQVLAILLRAFPDVHIAAEEVIAEGDKVVCRNTVTGTHHGEYMGHPPTGISIAYHEVFIARFTGGRIAEIWGVVDALSQMRQLGVIPGGPFMTTATASPTGQATR